MHTVIFGMAFQQLLQHRVFFVRIRRQKAKEPLSERSKQTLTDDTAVIYHLSRMVDLTDSPWLLLIHQIPQQPPYLRVKVWRRLQRIGSIAIKNSVYVLPRSEQSLEDFQWLAKEILTGGGEATVLEARFLDGLSNDQIIALFHAARETDYAQLLEETRRLSTEMAAGGASEQTSLFETEWARLKQRQRALEAIDFFVAPGGKLVAEELEQLENQYFLKSRKQTPGLMSRREDYQGAVWVTRQGIKYDRMSSAWLIQRFIDPQATFKFVPSQGYQRQPGEHDFDMFEAEFTHQGDLCTFEVLVRSFGLSDPALTALAEMIHDMDLKDEKFKKAETPGIELLLASLIQDETDDLRRIERCSALFNLLYAQLQARAERPKRPAGK